VSGNYGIIAGVSRQSDCPVTANGERPLTLSPREIEEIVERVILKMNRDR
jgi:hypothetical protein